MGKGADNGLTLQDFEENLIGRIHCGPEVFQSKKTIRSAALIAAVAADIEADR
jgi:hypothetical protein